MIVDGELEGVIKDDFVVFILGDRVFSKKIF